MGKRKYRIWFFNIARLSYYWGMHLSQFFALYRNQPMDLQCKSFDLLRMMVRLGKSIAGPIQITVTCFQVNLERILMRKSLASYIFFLEGIRKNPFL